VRLWFNQPGASLAGFGGDLRRQRRQRLALVGWLLFLVLCAAVIVGRWAWIAFFAACLLVAIGLLLSRIKASTAKPRATVPVTATGRLDATSASISDEQRRQVHENRRRARERRAP
jgi:hypothetical protein